MAEADTTQTADQCMALTEEGERCSRPAQDDGFCFQHDESDSTVSDSQAAEQETKQDEQTEQETKQDEQEPESSDTDAQETRSADMTAEAVTDPESVDADVDVEHEEIEGIFAIRQTVKSTAGQLIGREFDAVSEIAPTDDGWRAVVEVVERRSVPDTQDVIGRYEIELDTEGTVHGYRRLDRYRRGDTASFE